jgi:hypothetical protein
VSLTVLAAFATLTATSIAVPPMAAIAPALAA